MKLFSSALYAAAEKLEKVALFQWLRPAILTNPLQKKIRKRLRRFQSESAAFKFPLCIVDEALNLFALLIRLNLIYSQHNKGYIECSILPKIPV